MDVWVKLITEHSYKKGYKESVYVLNYYQVRAEAEEFVKRVNARATNIRSCEIIDNSDALQAIANGKVDVAADGLTKKALMMSKRYIRRMFKG